MMTPNRAGDSWSVITLVRGGKMISMINRWILIRLAALSLVVLGVTVMPTAAQAEDAPPPAPTFREVCGTLDEVYIPPVEGASYYRDVVNYDHALTENAYHLSGGAAYVKIIAEYMVVGPDGWAYNKQHVFEHTFDTSSPGDCVQAQDSGSVTVGACDPSTSRTQITITYTNTLEAGGYSVNRVDLMAYGSAGNGWAIPVTLGRVNDGQTVSWTGGLSDTLPVYPGHYVGQMMTLSPHRILVQEVKFTVPACGQYPLVEPGTGGSTGEPTVDASGIPVASLKLIKCETGRIKATMNNKRVTATSRFKLVRQPARGKPSVRFYTVEPRSVKRVYRSGTSSVFKVFTWNAKTKRWVKQDRLRTYSQSRCG